MMINGFNNIKDDIRDVRHEIKENNFYIYNKIDDLNNRYIQQTNKFNDELRNQDKKIIENEVRINEHERTLNELITSNVKQNVKINEHEVMLIRQQDSLMLCIDNVKKLYQEANEIRNDLLEKNEMIKNTCTFSGKSKLSMVAIFFRKKTSIRKAHFQFSFMPTAKKWQITPILLFRFRCGIFYCLYFYNSFSQDSKYS